MDSLFGALCGVAFTVFCISIFVPAWFSTAIWLNRAFELAGRVLVLGCIVAVPLSFRRMARRAIASLYSITSLVLFFVLWTECAIFVLSILGRPWLICGFLFAGIGILPEALIACVIARRWDWAVEIPGIIGVIALLNLAANFLAARSNLSNPTQGIPFVGEQGFYPTWAKGSGRWVFQRTLVTIGGMLAGQAEQAAAEVEFADEVIAWVPKRRGIRHLLGISALADERQLALSMLARLRLRCYGSGCNLTSQSEALAEAVVHEPEANPNKWHLTCPSCGGLVGPDLECVRAEVIIDRWQSTGKPELENPGASAIISSVGTIRDLQEWIQDNDPSHLEVAYVGQQLWPDIADMLDAMASDNAPDR